MAAFPSECLSPPALSLPGFRGGDGRGAPAPGGICLLLLGAATAAGCRALEEAVEGDGALWLAWESVAR